MYMSKIFDIYRNFKIKKYIPRKTFMINFLQIFGSLWIRKKKKVPSETVFYLLVVNSITLTKSRKFYNS